MKLLALAMLCTCLFAYSQENDFRSGIILGCNMNMHTGKDADKLWYNVTEHQYFPGLSAGVHVSRKFRKPNIDLRLELRYSIKGTKVVYPSQYGTPVYDKLKLIYAEFPVLLYVPVQRDLLHQFYIGLSYSYLVDMELYSGIYSSNKSLIPYYIYSHDFSSVFGYRIDLLWNMYLIIYYSPSMKSIVKDIEVHNKVIRFDLCIDF